MPNEITIPNDWRPRDYQLPIWSAMESGCKRAVAVWHRRSGKDSLALNWTAVAALERVGNYWHMLPEQSQARKAIWEAIDQSGRRIIDQAFPKEIRARTIDNSMTIHLKNGSIWQCVGSDNYNSLVGSNPVGIVMSEYSIADPAAWDYLRPILAQNGGWAMFIYTPRGRNHGQKLFTMAAGNPDWFAEILTVDDTKILPASVIEEERKSGMSDDMLRQEYYCDFNSAIVGAYYGKEITNAETSGRVCDIAYDRNFPVDTCWDIGIRDSTSIWFSQRIGRELRVIDYYEHSGEGLAHYAKVLQDRGYVYGTHIGPHDIMAREKGTGKSLREAASRLGIQFTIAPRLSVADGINAVRALLPMCWFDRTRCAYGIEILRMYRREYDDYNKTFHDKPLHDWASHGADAFRYGAIARDVHVPKSKVPEYEPTQHSRMPTGGGSWLGRL